MPLLCHEDKIFEAIFVLNSPETHFVYCFCLTCCLLPAQLAGIVVLALIADRGRMRCEICIFNNRETPCRLGQAIGAISFVLGIVLLVSDTATLIADDLLAERSRYSSWCQRALESSVSFMVTILWIVCFAVLFREWQARNFSLRRAMEQDGFRRDIDGQAIIAFSFIGFALWVRKNHVPVLRLQSYKLNDNGMYADMAATTLAKKNKQTAT